MARTANRFPTALAALAALTLTAGCGGAGEAAPVFDGPNVVLIVVDTLRADHLGSYGYERDTSPRLDELAAEGVRYARALSQAPWTTPSVASLMTSLYPTATGIGSEKETLSEELTLLPELLAEAGYRTGAVISHTFCSKTWNFDQGFDWFDQSNIGGHAAVTSESVTARALEFVDQAGAAPFFLWAHYFDPHFYYVEHPDHRFGGRGDYAGPIEPGLQFSRLFDLRPELGETDIAELVRIYDSEVAHTDRWVGALLDGLRERGLYEDTLIVFTADHGEEFFDHGDLGHARTLYQELINVPLIAKYPRALASSAPAARPGTVVDGHVALLDVFPTVLEVAGLPLPTGATIEGRSLLAAPDPARPIVSETARDGGTQSLVVGELKLIRNLDVDELELYDVRADFREATDLVSDRPEDRARLLDALDAWEQRTEARVAEELDLTAEDLEQLEQLGYAGADEDGH